MNNVCKPCLLARAGAAFLPGALSDQKNGPTHRSTTPLQVQVRTLRLSSTSVISKRPLLALPLKPRNARTFKTQASLTAGAESITSSVLRTIFADPPTFTSALKVNIGIFILAMPVLLAGLSPVGLVSAFVLGTLIWAAFGGQGFSVLSFYFLLGTAATKVRMKQKEAEGIAEKRQGRRGIGSVLGSAAVGMFCSLGVLLGWGGLGAPVLWQLGYVASLCTKFSDTIASEIGKAYGRTTYLVTTLKLVPRGTEGAISLEGTAAGLLAACVMAALAWALHLVDASGAILCVVASQVANLGESYLGATMQGRSGTEWLTNDLVNIINISLGATIAILFRVAWGPRA